LIIYFYLSFRPVEVPVADEAALPSTGSAPGVFNQLSQGVGWRTPQALSSCKKAAIWSLFLRKNDAALVFQNLSRTAIFYKRITVRDDISNLQ